MRIEVDWSAVDTEVVGARDGVRRSDLTALSARVAAHHDEVAAAARDGLLPHLDAGAEGQADRWRDRGLGWRRGKGKADRLLVVGEPTAVAAAGVLVGPHPDVRCVEGLDLDALQGALAGPGRVRLVVLDGPSWVRELAHALIPRVAAATVFRGDGLAGPERPLVGAELLEAPGAADPRFGVVGPAALALHAFAHGADDALAAALAAARSRFLVRAMLQNPAYRLASTLHVLEQRGQRQGLVFLVDSDRLAGWGAWASRAWAAISCKRVPDASGATRLRGSLPPCVRVGDEAATQRLLEGPALALVAHVVVGAGPAAAELLPGPQLLLQRQALGAAHARLLAARRQPVVQLRLPDASAAALATLSLLFLQAALVGTALDGGDPLRMDGADQWRGWLDAPPNPEGAGGWPAPVPAR